MDLSRTRALLERAVGDGAIPGAVLAVSAESGGLGLAVGWRALVPAREPTSADTAYDLASLTKALSTTTLAMQLVAEGRIELDDAAARWLPELDRAPHARITFRQLLCHASGLPAWRPLFESVSVGPGAREAMVAAVASEPLESAPGERSVYSDLGFLLLGAAIERAAGARLDVLFSTRVARPLGLPALGFADLAQGGHRPEPVAPTEDDPARGGLLRGEVHDENAHRMGGVAGHAGLFGAAADVARLARALLAAYHGTRGGIVEPEVVREFWRPCGISGSTWCLGWDRPSTLGYSSAGTRLPRTAVGHLGYTGGSIWIDPVAARAVVFLTNRVHPTRKNEAIRALRPALHDALCDDLGWYV